MSQGQEIQWRAAAGWRLRFQDEASKACAKTEVASSCSDFVRSFFELNKEARAKSGKRLAPLEIFRQYTTGI